MDRVAACIGRDIWPQDCSSGIVWQAATEEGRTQVLRGLSDRGPRPGLGGMRPLEWVRGW